MLILGLGVGLVFQLQAEVLLQHPGHDDSCSSFVQVFDLKANFQIKNTAFPHGIIHQNATSLYSSE